MKVEQEVWVIMDKERKMIACGVPRNRQIRKIEDAMKTRILTYQSEKKAINGFTLSGFYGSGGELEPVKVSITYDFD